MTGGERFRRVEQDFFVAPQLAEEDFAAAAAMGVRAVVNNRPDGESFDQIADVRARELATAAGLHYVHLPIGPEGLTIAAVEGLEAVMADAQGPVVAYCRSGTRSCHLWALAAARRLEPEAVIEAAAAAGYDVSGLRPVLVGLHGQH